MSNKYNLARNDLTRAFIFSNGVNRFGDSPLFAPRMGMDGLSKDIGEPSNIEVPSATKYGAFDVALALPGEESRMTSTLQGYMSMSEASLFNQLAKQRCNFDLHLHFGMCTNPSDFNTYDKVLIFQDVLVTSYNTEALVALTSGDRAQINESLDVSIGDWFEVLPLSYIERGAVQTAGVTPLIGGVVADTRSCGADCDDPSNGCEKIYLIDADGEVLFSLDGSVSWAQYSAGPMVGEVDDVQVGLDYLNGYLWSYGQGGHINYITREGVRDGDAFATTSGLPTTGTAQAANTVYGVVVGTAGTILVIKDVANGVDSNYTGDITTNALNDVKFSGDNLLIGGAANTIIYSADGETFELVTGPTAQAAVAVTAVQPITDQKWLVGYADGKLYGTDDAGVSWTGISVPTTAAFADIDMQSMHVIWATAGDDVLKSIDGGRTWKTAPESGKKTLPANTVMNVVLACSENPNFVLAAGQDTSTAGMIINGYTVNNIK